MVFVFLMKLILCTISQTCTPHVHYFALGSQIRHILTIINWIKDSRQVHYIIPFLNHVTSHVHYKSAQTIIILQTAITYIHLYTHGKYKAQPACIPNSCILTGEVLFSQPCKHGAAHYHFDNTSCFELVLSSVVP